MRTVASSRRNKAVEQWKLFTNNEELAVREYTFDTVRTKQLIGIFPSLTTSKRFILTDTYFMSHDDFRRLGAALATTFPNLQKTRVE